MRKSIAAQKQQIGIVSAGLRSWTLSCLTIGMLINGCARDQSRDPPLAVTEPEKSARSVPENSVPSEATRAPEGMVFIPGGTFVMGCNERYAFANERPAHEIRVSGFYLDVKPVTNRQYSEFVSATNYQTVAERPVDWEQIRRQVLPGTPKPPDNQLAPGSLVFRPTSGEVDLADYSQWWHWTLGACWRCPEGPGSTLDGREDHPVVHIAFEDAEAYAVWAKKRLPTEAEWEFAARGGLVGARYAWGNEERPRGEIRLNRWDGAFPFYNSQEDGFAGTSPVGSFPPNGYGLYDMGGNVWNWCVDRYAADTYAWRADQPRLCIDPRHPPPGAGIDWIPGDPSPPTAPGVERRVIKGGSFLCHPDYCESYRPSARRGVPPDSGTSHIGFRCALSASVGKEHPPAADGRQK